MARLVSIFAQCRRCASGGMVEFKDLSEGLCCRGEETWAGSALREEAKQGLRRDGRPVASSQAEGHGQGHCRVGGQQGLSKVGAMVLIWAVIWSYEGEWGRG